MSSETVDLKIYLGCIGLLIMLKHNNFCGILVYLTCIAEAFKSAIGNEKFQTGTNLFFQFVQQPRLNKQVSESFGKFTFYVDFSPVCTIYF